jgi:hypothetical protein
MLAAPREVGADSDPTGLGRAHRTSAFKLAAARQHHRPAKIVNLADFAFHLAGGGGGGAGVAGLPIGLLKESKPVA